MVELSVPVDFMCPISLDLMTDPVTLTTGQTYDRRSIEKWFETGHTTCPSTMQVVKGNDVAPNRTLQRLIRRWCACNDFNVAAVDGGVHIPAQHRRHSSTPNLGDRLPSTADLGDGELPSTATATAATATWRQVKQILQQVALGIERYNSLKKLKSLAMDSNHKVENRRVLRDAGAIPILAQFAFSPENLSRDLLECCEIALGVVTVLLLPLRSDVNSSSNNNNHQLLVLVGNNTKQLTAISYFLNRGSLDARANAAMVLASLCQDDDEFKLLVGATAGVFEGLVQLLKEDLYPRARDAALKAVVTIVTGVDRNIVRAVDAGVVFAVAEMLPDAERRSKDRALTELLELVCSSAEGQVAVSKHGLIVPMLVRIISRRDGFASESAISCLWTVCQFSPQKCVDEAAGQAGILIQLWHFCQCDDSRINPQNKLKAADLRRRVRQRINDCDDRS
ncbi:unnamed protein product [Calypogeia fissa]